MRRADRLFQIVQLLRGGRVVTAASIAKELEVSLRTVCRDVRDLIAAGVPIDGEAGVGYCLLADFDLPPLMFDDDEIGALVLGARMVQAWGDAALAKSARSVLSKVETVLPDRLKERVSQVELFAPQAHSDRALSEETRAVVEHFRRGIDQRREVRFGYTDRHGVETERDARPLCLLFWGTTWTANAWCELRGAFRNSRPDRMRDFELLSETFEDEPGRDLAALTQLVHAAQEARGKRRDPQGS